MAGLLARGKVREFGGFSLPDRHSQPRPSKPQSAEHQRGSISAHHHGNPRLPSQAGLLVGPTAQLFANSQDFAYSAPRIPRWTCRPPPPSGFFWTACPAPPSAPPFPWQSLGNHSTWQSLSEEAPSGTGGPRCISASVRARLVRSAPAASASPARGGRGRGC